MSEVTTEVIAVLKRDRDEDIEYRPLRLAPGETGVLVRSAVRRRGAESTEAGWKVYDVKIAGVSLVITYRETFASARAVAGALPEAAGRTPS